MRLSRKIGAKADPGEIASSPPARMALRLPAMTRRETLALGCEEEARLQGDTKETRDELRFDIPPADAAIKRCDDTKSRTLSFREPSTAT